MKYYVIERTNQKASWNSRKFKRGFTFNKKECITLYESNMIRYVLTTKLNKILKKYINIYLNTSDEDASDTTIGNLLPKIETMRKVLLKDYAPYLRATDIESYLTRLEKLEMKINKKINKITKKL